MRNPVDYQSAVRRAASRRSGPRATGVYGAATPQKRPGLFSRVAPDAYTDVHGRMGQTRSLGCLQGVGDRHDRAGPRLSG